MRLFCGASTFALFAATLSAQWINYPSKGFQEGDGSPNLTAPGRRARRHPSLAGIWMQEQNRPCERKLPRFAVSEEFFNIGFRVPVACLSAVGGGAGRTAQGDNAKDIPIRSAYRRASSKCTPLP